MANRYFLLDWKECFAGTDDRNLLGVIRTGNWFGKGSMRAEEIQGIAGTSTYFLPIGTSDECIC